MFKNFFGVCDLISTSYRWIESRDVCGIIRRKVTDVGKGLECISIGEFFPFKVCMSMERLLDARLLVDSY